MKDEGKIVREVGSLSALVLDLGVTVSIATYLCIPSGQYFNSRVLRDV